MNQGAKAHKFADRSHDLYETPECATLALLRVEALPKRIWEPAAGRGALSRVLTAHGHEVVAEDLVGYQGRDRDIWTGVDFLEEHQRPKGFDTIVTNPPYKLADQFVRHGLSLVSTVIVLQRLMAIEGAGRSDLVDRHLKRVWAGVERLPMLHRDGWAGRRLNGSGFPFAWFVFSREPRAADAPIELRRMSWRQS